MATEAATVRLFGHPVASPFMSFAPKLLPAAAAALPAAAHLDGTARIQTVSETDEPWLFALLSAVERLLGWAVLLNTSFNVKGKPIVNSIAAALDIWDGEEKIHALVIEEHVFTRPLFYCGSGHPTAAAAARCPP